MNKIICLFTIFILLNINLFSQSWFKSLYGKIGNSSALLNIIRYDNNVKAFYYYEKYCKPIELSGNFNGDSLILSAYFDNLNETFRGVYKKGFYSGFWTSSENENNKLQFAFSENPSYNSEFLYVTGKEKMFKNEEIPFAEYFEGVFWPSANFPNSNFIRSAILKIKSIPEGIHDIKKHLLKNKKAFMDEYKAVNKNYSKEEVEGNYSFNMEEHSFLIPVFFNEKIFSFAYSSYWYTGGAHGNYGTLFYSLDLKNKKILNIEDILTLEGISILPNLLEKNYRAQFYIPENAKLNEYLFVDTIPVNETFLITKGTLMFNYNPYQISSFAAGEIRIFIPFEDFSLYIKPEAAGLFN